MARPQAAEKTVSFRPTTKKILTEPELRALEGELKKFYKPVTRADGSTGEIFDELRWMEFRGAMRRGAVIVKDGMAERYEDCLDELEQFQKWKGRKEYGARERLKQLDKTM